MKQPYYFNKHNLYKLEATGYKSLRCDCVTGKIYDYQESGPKDIASKHENVHGEDINIANSVIKYSGKADQVLAFPPLRYEVTYKSGTKIINLDRPVIQKDSVKVSFRTTFQYGSVRFLYIKPDSGAEIHKPYTQTTSPWEGEGAFPFDGDTNTFVPVNFTMSESMTVNGTIDDRSVNFTEAAEPFKETYAKATVLTPYKVRIDYQVPIRCFMYRESKTISNGAVVPWLTDYELQVANDIGFVINAVTVDAFTDTFRKILDDNGNVIDAPEDFKSDYTYRFPDNELLAYGAKVTLKDGSKMELVDYVVKDIISHHKDGRKVLLIEQMNTPLFTDENFTEELKDENKHFLDIDDVVAVQDLSDNWVLGYNGQRYFKVCNIETSTQSGGVLWFQACECIEVTDPVELAEITR